jgi:hypothetical protein
MKTGVWVIVLSGVGALLSLKDANWLGDSTPKKLAVLASGLLVGAAFGLCIGQIVKPVKSKGERVYKPFLWICAFAFLGLALGHGNVPWSRTLEIIGYSCLIGAVIGALHYLLARPPNSTFAKK